MSLISGWPFDGFDLHRSILSDGLQIPDAEGILDRWLDGCPTAIWKGMDGGMDGCQSVIINRTDEEADKAIGP